MFGSPNSPQRSLVTLHLEDGSKTVVSVKLPLSGKLQEAFNNADMFLDVISAKGEAALIAKSRILRAEPADPPHAKLNQQRRSSDRSSFNPYTVLGVENTAGKEEIRAAYVALVKMYHPDRYALLDIPQEMKDYAAAMQARINMAYEQIGS
jgi:DnaJ-domain-containing protein 1